MTGVGDIQQQQRRFEWVRCRRCGNVLWRRYPDHVEMSLTPRGGQKRVIRAPVDAVLGLGVTCEKCQSVTVASSDGTRSTLP